MWSALGGTLTLAMGLALSPIAITTALILLLGPRGKTRTALFAFGWFDMMFVITVIPMWLTDAADENDPVATDDGIDVLHLVFGVLFLILAVVTWRKRPAADRVEADAERALAGDDGKPGLFDRLDGMGLLVCLGLGLAEGVVIVKNLPLAISAGARLGSAGLSNEAGLVASLIFAAVASIAIVAPLIAALVGGERVVAPLREARRWIELHMTAITLVVLLIVGVLFLGEGLGLAD